jgi:hypothetical protein
MVRGISLLAMAGGFLMISPHLREDLLGSYAHAGVTMDTYSPYSYVALGVVVAGALIVFLYKSSQPRH